MRAAVEAGADAVYFGLNLLNARARAANFDVEELRDVVAFLHERGVAVLGSDCVSDPIPLPPIEGWGMPIHECTLVAMGVHLLDNLDLSGLRATCDELSQWDFQLSIGPLRIEEGTGSPVNPIAVL